MTLKLKSDPDVYIALYVGPDDELADIPGSAGCDICDIWSPMATTARTYNLEWNVVLENCVEGSFINLNRIAKQWIRVEAVGVVLHINYEANDGVFSVEWFRTLRRRGNDPSLDSCNAAHALQGNPWYETSAHDSTTVLATTQDSGQANDNAYNQINEEDVYMPSGHDYCEIKDEDASGETQQVTHTNVYKNILNKNIDNVSGQGSQTEKCEGGDESVTFYAAVSAAVKLPETSNVGAKPAFYNTDIDKIAPVDCRMEKLSTTEPALYKTDTDNLATVNCRMEKLSTTEPALYKTETDNLATVNCRMEKLSTTEPTLYKTDTDNVANVNCRMEKLPTTEPALYKTDTDKLASVNCRISVTNCADSAQTAYELTDHTDISYETSGDVTRCM
ncbi:Hypp4547 [Branchiostoma lanceolatum]|uniref:Hypp4547 protein n=1 Tax=Branchiostoma lanceolatum TaxID=7740 RepID=A0A8K0F1E7_BRALA|nr:Hypp4547 [Branchiostoma lanceolatum]